MPGQECPRAASEQRTPGGHAELAPLAANANAGLTAASVRLTGVGRVRAGVRALWAGVTRGQGSTRRAEEHQSPGTDPCHHRDLTPILGPPPGSEAEADLRRQLRPRLLTLPPHTTVTFYPEQCLEGHN